MMPSVPITSRLVIVTSPPVTSTSVPPAMTPVRIFGPCRSPRIATARCRRRESSRMRRMTSVLAEWSPCEKLRRKTSAPTSIRASSICSDAQAGPTVATILVRRNMRLLFLRPRFPCPKRQRPCPSKGKGLRGGRGGFSSVVVAALVLGVCLVRPLVAAEAALFGHLHLFQGGGLRRHDRFRFLPRVPSRFVAQRDRGI